MRQTKQNAATTGVSLVVLDPPWGPLWPWAGDIPILDMDVVVDNKKPVLHADIIVGGSHTSIVRWTKQNAATFGVSVVVLGLLLGSLWPWVCNMPFLDLNEVGKNHKPFYMRLFLGEGHILASKVGQSKMQQRVSVIVLGPLWGLIWPWCAICPS